MSNESKVRILAQLEKLKAEKLNKISEQYAELRGIFQAIEFEKERKYPYKLNAETLAKRVEDEIVKRVLEENLKYALNIFAFYHGYEHKNEIIDRVVERATKEIARKAMPLVIAKLDEEDRK